MQADISMQAHDREWTALEGHTRAVTSLAYTVDGAYMLSGTSQTIPGCMLGACTAISDGPCESHELMRSYILPQRACVYLTDRAAFRKHLPSRDAWALQDLMMAL